MIRKREEQFNLVFPIQILRNNISPSFPLLATLPLPTTSTLMPLSTTITSLSLHHSHFFVSLSSLPHAFPPKNLSPSTAASLFHCYIHSSDDNNRLRRSPYPHAAAASSAGLVAVNRHKLMGESGFSDYQVSVFQTIRAHPGPMSGSIAMKRGCRNPEDAALDEEKVALANENVVYDNSSCTMATGMIVSYNTLSPPPKPPPWPYEIDGVGDKWYRFISCCRRYGHFPFTYVDHSLQFEQPFHKQGLNVLKLESTEGKSHFVFKLHPLHDPSLNAYTTLDSAYKLHASAISNSESSQIASLANCVPREGGLMQINSLNTVQ